MTQLVPERKTTASYKGKVAQSQYFYNPKDCRPAALRIHVLTWDDGTPGKVSLIEGNGQLGNFCRHGESLIPVADEASIAAAVKAMDGVAVWPDVMPDAKGIAAGMLVRSRFILDDFYGSTAWLLPSGDDDGWTVFVRAEPEPRSVEVGPDETEIFDMPLAELDPEGPVEIGLDHENGGSRLSTVAPSLEQALATMQALLDLPRPEESMTLNIAYEVLLPQPFVEPSVKRHMRPGP